MYTREDPEIYRVRPVNQANQNDGPKESTSGSGSVVSDTCHPVGRIVQARILEWVATPSSRGSLQPRDRTQVSHIAGGFFTL